MHSIATTQGDDPARGSSDLRVLDEARARRAEVVLALTSKDQDNLAVCQIARRMFRVPRTVGLVNDPENGEVFRKLGVSVAFSATQIIARILEERAGFEEISSLIPVAEGKVTVSEVVLRPESPAASSNTGSKPSTAGCSGSSDGCSFPRGAVTDPDSWAEESRRFLRDRELRQLATFAFLYPGTLTLGTGIPTAYGYPLKESLFEFASALGTVGLSAGVTSAFAPPGLLWAETAGIILGRMEFFVVCIGMTRLIANVATMVGSTWKED